MAEDFLGQKIKEGDAVAYLQHYKTSSTLLEGHIERITNKTVFLKEGHRKEFSKIIKINNEMFLLKVAHAYDTQYEPIGLFSSMEDLTTGKAEYLKKKAAEGLNVDDYQFVFERYQVNKLSQAQANADCFI